MAKRIPAGMLRHRVSLQSPSTVLDSYGQASTTGTWQTDATLRAAITPLRGREAELARQVYAEATYKVTLEYNTGMNSTGVSQKRLLFGDRQFHIGAVLNPDEEDFYHELLCSEER